MKHLHRHNAPTMKQQQWNGLSLFGLELEFACAAPPQGFAGAAWRGLLGQALSTAVCAYTTPHCSMCPQVAACAYPLLFKPLDATALPPFWLHGWRRNRDGWRLGIRWLGEQHYSIGEWLNALGRSPQTLTLHGLPAQLQAARDAASHTSVWQRASGWLQLPKPLSLDVAPTPPRTCQIRCRTPLVSKHTGDPLFGALHTRLQRLVQQYGNGAVLPHPTLPWNCHTITHKPQRIPLARRVLSGALWELELCDITPDAWALLQAGTQLHAGGQTMLGCGHYEIHTKENNP